MASATSSTARRCIFTNLITYDALYYKSTDAAAYYDAYGDIVGGIGSYPVLGSPHYHQSHDVLETINHQLVTEVAKTTVATLMLLASSPSRLTDLAVSSIGGKTTVTWKAAVEKGVTEYIVACGPADKPEAQQTRVTTPTATLSGVTAGMVVSVIGGQRQGDGGLGLGLDHRAIAPRESRRARAGTAESGARQKRDPPRPLSLSPVGVFHRSTTVPREVTRQRP